MSNPTLHTTPSMNKKQQFLRAVQILALGDHFILQAAERVREESLPYIPGGAALEFVTAMEKFKSWVHWQVKALGRKRKERAQHQNKTYLLVNTGGSKLVGKTVPVQHPLAVQHALSIQRAECWFKLGQLQQALMKLERLPKTAWKHPWAMRVRVAATGAVRELNEIALQE